MIICYLEWLSIVCFWMLCVISTSYRIFKSFTKGLWRWLRRSTNPKIKKHDSFLSLLRFFFSRSAYSFWMLFLGVNDLFELDQAEVELDRIEISSPSSSLARGTTVNLNATAIYKNNTHRDISSEGVWSSADSNILKLLTLSQFKGMNPVLET